MKAKYILRGLGLGMIITAVLMSAYTKNAVANARVDVLKEYGIGEEAALAETLVDVGGSQNDENEDVEAVKSAEEESVLPVTIPYDEELESESHSVLDAAEAMEQGQQGVDSGDALENQPKETETMNAVAGGQENTVTIEISRGDDSGTVARKLYNAGIVENAAEFDAFLMQHGYDKKLNTGTKIINVTDSWQEIAEKLAKK